VYHNRLCYPWGIISKILIKNLIIHVNFACVDCELDNVMVIEWHILLVIENSAQGLLASYKSLALVAIHYFEVVSYYETKNIIHVDGGTLLMIRGFLFGIPIIMYLLVWR
jgi:dTDP-4-amino-4,6-dideoxygalactose transaminase